MGIIRKTSSMFTAGLIDFRSDKERTAAYSKGVRKEAKKQTKLMQQQLAAQQATAAPAPMAVSTPSTTPQLPPSGWYQDANNPAVNRWFDGTKWTEHVQPVNPPPAL